LWFGSFRSLRAQPSGLPLQAGTPKQILTVALGLNTLPAFVPVAGSDRQADDAHILTA
jgi:hypothetical protein